MKLPCFGILGIRRDNVRRRGGSGNGEGIKPGDVIAVDGTYGWVTALGGRYVSAVTRGPGRGPRLVFSETSCYRLERPEGLPNMAFMHRYLARLGAICTLLLGPALPTAAHHSFAVYDFSQQIPFEGVVETLNFKNPHISMTLRRTSEDGETEIINFIEGAPANMLVRQGLSPDLIQPGTRITAFGSPLREDPSQYFLRNVRLEDGREFPTGGPR